MDELIVIFIRWIAEALGNRKNGSPARSATPQLPPIWTTAGRPQLRPTPPAPRLTLAGRGVRRAKGVRGVAPVKEAPITMQVVPDRKPKAPVASSHSETPLVRASLTAESIRRQWLMYELLQPPVALRQQTHP